MAFRQTQLLTCCALKEKLEDKNLEEICKWLRSNILQWICTMFFCSVLEISIECVISCFPIWSKALIIETDFYFCSFLYFHLLVLVLFILIQTVLLFISVCFLFCIVSLIGCYKFAVEQSDKYHLVARFPSHKFTWLFIPFLQILWWEYK